ncbi:acyl-CoA Delta(11) desaturase-like [Leguminivora glycinivorella]|uniref:acyl-CoA Delta(11) desaturase-like n=1 Tax=Leguminivora glycinivorella TaxID=1035111 RepID=UPI00200D2198|nr:acyl-CoA Delta(11) desaturase-like [Leguminivora glycinivorella]
MAPNIKEDIPLPKEEDKPSAVEKKPWNYQIVYINVLIFAYWHIGGLYGLYLCLDAKWPTILFNVFYYILGGWGVTAGTHRLWSHRAYKAKLPLEILLMLFQSSTAQTSVIHWCRDHRCHHKFCDTDADPHDSTKGMFFSHMGWLMVRRHPDVIKKGKTIDMSDLTSNPVLHFQLKYYVYLSVFFTFLLPALVPYYFWAESFTIAYHISLLRLVIFSHVTFCINSAAHKYGYKPYDKNITPTQIPALSFAALGEGYHNYHHVFPYDYKTAELGNNFMNLATNLIDFMAWIGWAYDLKSVSEDMVVKKMMKTGDGTDLWGRLPENDDYIWGWGDQDMSEEDKKALLHF